MPLSSHLCHTHLISFRNPNFLCFWARPQIGATLFITHISTALPCSPEARTPIPRLLIDVHGISSELDLLSEVTRFARGLGYQVATDKWSHDPSTRAGSTMLGQLASTDGNPESLLVSWGYDALDDIDLATSVALPIDHQSHAYGSLTPNQVDTFWQHVVEELQPFELFDDLVRQMGLTPREHDVQDVWVMRFVLALEWWRSYPTVEAGEQALTLHPELTNAVVAQVALMASRCFIEGSNYELADILVYT